jgi:hypothetical protein
MEKPLRDLARVNTLTLLYSGDGRDGSTSIRQDAEIYYGAVDAAGIGEPIEVPASDALCHGWVQVISGEVTVLGHTLTTADGLAIEDAPQGFSIWASRESRFLVFRLA